MDGTEDLSGAATAPPPVDPSLDGAPGAQQPGDPNPQQPVPASPQAPPAGPAPDLGGDQPLDLGQAAQPNVAAKQPSGIERLFDSVADFLSPKEQSHTVIDDQGNRHTVQDKPMSRGQQWAHVGLTALTGAAEGAAAPAGPGHVSQGFANGVLSGVQEAQQKKAGDQAQAEQDFGRRQKAKQDALNYALGTRDLATKTFQLTRMGAKATQDDLDFADKQQQRERDLGSFDLGNYQGAMDLHQVMEKQPDFFKSLGNNQIVGVPTFDENGKRTGLQIYERKADVGKQQAPDGTQFAVFTPASKPGESPRLVWKTASPGQLSNDDVTRYNTAAMTQMMDFQKKGADIAETKAKAAEATSAATRAPAENAKDYAEAAKAYADARKTKVEAANESGGGEGGSGNLQTDAHMMVDGLASPEQFSKRSKDYNAMLPEADRYSMQKYGVHFDAEISQGRYLARRDTIKAFGSGKEGDQIQSFNQFLAHAGDLSKVVDELRNTNSPLLNTPLKSLRKAMGDDRYAKIEPMIAAVRTEHANFLNNNHALHDADISEGHEMLDDNMSLAQMQGGIKSFVHTAVARAGALNQRYRRVVGVGDVPDLLDPYSRNTLNILGMAPEAQAALGSAWTQQPTVQQQVASPPPPQVPGQPQQPQQQAAPPVARPAAQGVKAPQRPQGIPGNFVFILDSKGGQHWIPQGNLAKAQQMDPHLQVGQ